MKHNLNRPHGSPDGGAVGISGVLEKDINLAISKKIVESGIPGKPAPLPISAITKDESDCSEISFAISFVALNESKICLITISS